jgi:hypothetical protein
MKTAAMTAARRFPEPAVEELAKAKILGVRAGVEHGYTGVWVVVVQGRVFVRSWNDKPTGWDRAFLTQPLGSIQVAGQEIAVRARRLRGERLRDAVTRVYAGKYTTKASEKWVRGFAEPGRATTTLELWAVRILTILAVAVALNVVFWAVLPRYGVEAPAWFVIAFDVLLVVPLFWLLPSLLPLP